MERGTQRDPGRGYESGGEHETDGQRRADGGTEGERRADEEGETARAFCALVEGDLRGVPEGARGSLYRLFPGPVDASAMERLTAGDLTAELGPRTV